MVKKERDEKNENVKEGKKKDQGNIFTPRCSKDCQQASRRSV